MIKNKLFALVAVVFLAFSQTVTLRIHPLHSFMQTLYT